MEYERFDKELELSVMSNIYSFNKSIEQALKEDNSMKTMQYVSSFDLYSLVNSRVLAAIGKNQKCKDCKKEKEEQK